MPRLTSPMARFRRASSRECWAKTKILLQELNKLIATSKLPPSIIQRKNSIIKLLGLYQRRRQQPTNPFPWFLWSRVAPWKIVQVRKKLTLRKQAWLGSDHLGSFRQNPRRRRQILSEEHSNTSRQLQDLRHKTSFQCEAWWVIGSRKLWPWTRSVT